MKRTWILAGLAGALWGASLVLLYQIFKERRRWDEQENVCPGRRQEFEEDEELMDF